MPDLGWPCDPHCLTVNGIICFEVDLALQFLGMYALKTSRG